MAIRNPFMVKTIIGTTKPELKADPGEAFLIKDIMVGTQRQTTLQRG